LRHKTFTRAPLNLVAVVDKSGSMSGQPLALVKASLVEALNHLVPQDQLTIVLYGDQVHVHLPATPVKDKASIISSGLPRR
jgi:Ca-activated chloride channel family protein